MAHIQPGGFFGEKALLTGEPRIASVQAETEVIRYGVDREILLPIFQGAPELLERISERMAARKIQLKKAKKAGAEQEKVEQKENNSLLQKMRNFYWNQAVIRSGQLSVVSFQQRLFTIDTALKGCRRLLERSSGRPLDEMTPYSALI